MERIYIVIQYCAYDAIPQGAFYNEDEAYEALNLLGKRSPNGVWKAEVKSCTLHKS